MTPAPSTLTPPTAAPTGPPRTAPVMMEPHMAAPCNGSGASPTVTPSKFPRSLAKVPDGHILNDLVHMRLDSDPESGFSSEIILFSIAAASFFVVCLHSAL